MLRGDKFARKLIELSGRINLKAYKNVIVLVRNSLFCMQLLEKPDGNKSTKICVKYKETDVLSKDHYQNVEEGITQGLKGSGRGRAKQKRSRCDLAARAVGSVSWWGVK